MVIVMKGEYNESNSKRRKNVLCRVQKVRDVWRQIHCETQAETLL